MRKYKLIIEVELNVEGDDLAEALTDASNSATKENVSIRIVDDKRMVLNREEGSIDNLTEISQIVNNIIRNGLN